MDLDDITPEDIVKAVAEGGRRALQAHKISGHPIAVWRDDRVVLIPSKEIEIPAPELWETRVRVSNLQR
jgi:hypothetical protein